MCRVDGPNMPCLNSHFAQQILHPCESHKTLGNVPENASWWQDANCSVYQCILETCKMPDYLQFCCKPVTKSKNLRLRSMIPTWLHVYAWHSATFHRDSNGYGAVTAFAGPHLSYLLHSIQLVSRVHGDQSCALPGLRPQVTASKDDGMILERQWNDMEHQYSRMIYNDERSNPRKKWDQRTNRFNWWIRNGSLLCRLFSRASTKKTTGLNSQLKPNNQSIKRLQTSEERGVRTQNTGHHEDLRGLALPNTNTSS